MIWNLGEQVALTLRVMAAFPPPPPQGLNYLAVIKPSLQDIFIGQTFTVLEVILLGCLLYFSRSTTRRKLVFILNILTLLLSIVVGILLDYRAVNTILSPLHAIPLSFDLAVGLLGVIQYILVDTTLFVRLVSVYPRSSVGTYKFLALITLPILLKILRVTNLIIFTTILAHAIASPNGAVKFQTEWSEKPYLKIEWLSAAVDNAYASSLFLWTLWHRRKAHSTSGVTSFGRGSFSRRLAVIFWMAVSSFALPFLFSIAQVIVVFQPKGAVSPAIINQIVLVNTSLAVVGVVFATVWAESRAWMEDRAERGPSSSYGLSHNSGYTASSDEKGRLGIAHRQHQALELQQLERHRLHDRGPAGQTISTTSTFSIVHPLELKSAVDSESTVSVTIPKVQV